MEQAVNSPAPEHPIETLHYGNIHDFEAALGKHPAVEQPEEQAIVDSNRLFSGSWGFFKGLTYRNPVISSTDLAPSSESYYHVDFFWRITSRPRDLLRYISPSNGKTHRAIIQAAPGAQAQGNWRRRKVTGNPPIVAALVYWAHSSKTGKFNRFFSTFAKSILIFPVVVIYASLPRSFEDKKAPWRYPAVLHQSREYPKHVLNPLDAHPRAPASVSGNREYDAGVSYNIHEDLKRLIRPRALIVYRHGMWNVEEDGRFTGPYLFISFAAMHFVKTVRGTANEQTLDIRELDDRARRLVSKLGMSAYWADYHCRAAAQPEATDDVHRFCDVVRGAAQVMILLPDKSPHAFALYGQRLWCLPDVILARNHKVFVCTPDPECPVDSIETVELMEMVSRAWAVKITPENKVVSDGNEETFRLLVEHITWIIDTVTP
ncbi:hypothetical protein VTL71DRAFT_1999 [Oculimacula yallundae]|uniref:Uncharacterized protein n=1 Tax=Oculimacula yallundae TaxID=86028 RepID=A0ABR4CCD2_9HELO